MLLKTMKNEQLAETCVTVEYPRRTAEVERVIGYIQYISQQDEALPALADGEIFAIAPEEVLYIESVDRKTFLYTTGRVYETPSKLYELESAYSEYMRISKNCIINLQRIHSIRPELGAKLLATMDNGEKVFISRQFAAAFKEKIGLGGKRR